MQFQTRNSNVSSGASVKNVTFPNLTHERSYDSPPEKPQLPNGFSTGLLFTKRFKTSFPNEEKPLLKSFSKSFSKQDSKSFDSFGRQARSADAINKVNTRLNLAYGPTEESPAAHKYSSGSVPPLESTSSKFSFVSKFDRQRSAKDERHVSTGLFLLGGNRSQSLGPSPKTRFGKSLKKLPTLGKLSRDYSETTVDLSDNNGVLESKLDLNHFNDTFNSNSVKASNSRKDVGDLLDVVLIEEEIIPEPTLTSSDDLKAALSNNSNSTLSGTSGVSAQFSDITKNEPERSSSANLATILKSPDRIPWEDRKMVERITKAYTKKNAKYSLEVKETIDKYNIAHVKHMLMSRPKDPTIQNILKDIPEPSKIFICNSEDQYFLGLSNLPEPSMIKVGNKFVQIALSEDNVEQQPKNAYKVTFAEQGHMFVLSDALRPREEVDFNISQGYHTKTWIKPLKA